ncbi:MAG: AmmeMemoRadiSam system protein A [Armatimonadota bacterium]|nr:AmmeMemoRadiSam system protein A [Armatimonadota bacterium]MDW8290733.1 AmmeMemoRadiSam system protein A [Armatimonadota bacterium]
MSTTTPHPYAQLAREAVEHFLRDRKVVEPPPDLPPPPVQQWQGVFVSIHTSDGQLRGCIGTLRPVHPDIGREIIHVALDAALRDPRFPPVDVSELHDLTYTVYVLHPPEPVQSPEELDPRVYGVIVHTEDGRRGLLLPDLPEVDTVEQQLRIACMKAGIAPDEPFSVERFRAEKLE